MLGIRLPPTKPVPTRQIPRTYWTIHSQPNNAFTTRAHENSRTSVVSFADFDDAFLIGKMIDTYYVRQKELPNVTTVGQLILPTPGLGDVLHHVYIQKWDFDELKVECTRNILDLMTVNGLRTTKFGYSFSGTVYKFEATDPDFYRSRFEELLPLNNDPDDGPY